MCLHGIFRNHQYCCTIGGVHKCSYYDSNNRIEKGLDIDDIFLSEFKIYKRKVRVLTRKNRETLIGIWNGTDYYDGEYIKDNFDLEYINPQYPTIDHKISIFDGFKEGFTAEEISSLDNLCFTKRSINSSKNSLSEVKYKQKNQSLRLVFF